MKKRLLFLAIIGLVGFMTGCSTYNEEVKKEEQKENQVISCLVTELGAYIMAEKTNITDIPRKEFTDKSEDISYYKGARTDANNMYAIVQTDEYEVIRDFNKYFIDKYDTYQTYSTNDNIYIYFHSSNELDLDDLKKCSYSESIDKEEVEKMDSKTIDKLQKTNKIRIYMDDKEIGIIKNWEAIDEILNAVSISEQIGNNFLCDGHAFDFKMYDDGGKLIDTLYVWGDGKRLIPESIHSGCGYYTLLNYDIDIRKTIERETDFVFYSFYNISDSCKQNILIYEDKKYNYYLNCRENGNMLIRLGISNLQMNVKYALNNKYVTIEQLLEYSDNIIKEEK